MDDSKESGWCAIRPTEEKDKVKNWGDRILQGDDDEIGGYADYLKNDPFTDEGLDAIAVFNDYKSEWDQVKDEMGPDAAMHIKRWKNWSLYAQMRTRRKIHLDPMEGGHRALATHQVVLCKDIDLRTGTITEQSDMTPQKFQNAGLLPKSDQFNLTTDYIDAACFKATDSKDRSPFFKDFMSVKVRYFHDFNESVPKCLEACRIVSGVIAKNKRSAATKDPFTEVGMDIVAFLASMSDDALMNNPDLRAHPLTLTNKLPTNVSKTAFKQKITTVYEEYNRNVLQQGVPLCPVLYSDEFERYCETPFSRVIEQNFIKAFQSGIFVKYGDEKPDKRYVSSKEKEIMPPFLPTYEAMAIHPSIPNGTRVLNVDMVNKLCLLPKAMHTLYCHKFNKNRYEATKDEHLTQLVKYTMRHHVYKFGVSNCVGLHVMEYGYNRIKENANLAGGTTSVISLAALYITEIVNCALLKVRGESLQDRRQSLNRQLSSISDFLSHLAHNSGNATTDVLIDALGKFIVPTDTNIPQILTG